MGLTQLLPLKDLRDLVNASGNSFLGEAFRRASEVRKAAHILVVPACDWKAHQGGPPYGFHYLQILVFIGNPHLPG